jgi:drug/metabolite transporter (DMT)-like permease
VIARAPPDDPHRVGAERAAGEAAPVPIVGRGGEAPVARALVSGAQAALPFPSRARKPPSMSTTAATADQPHRPLAGCLWMMATGLCFVAVTGIVKHVGSEIPAAQAAFLRFLLGLVFLLPVLPALLRLRLDSASLRLFGLRGAVHTIAVLLWFYAMTQIPIVEVTAMNYLTPIYVTAGAALLLGERLAARRIAAIAFGLIGALVILRPGFREVSPGHVAMVFTAVFMAGSYLIAKRMSADFAAGLVVALLSITVTIGLAPFALAVWVPPSPVQLGWLFLVALFATAGHYSMTRAFAIAPVTITQPVTFLQLVWAALVGLVFFAEPVDGFVILGGAIIMASVTYITWREAMLRRRSGGSPAGPAAP